MNSLQEEDEFVAVRVQDPRVQNEGSWNSYVDYKIFLHTNSKAFTAKTSCVRRRYSEFVWLKKKLQKNAGLVPVPDLPGKSFFSFSSSDFLEGRRKGLQAFLDKVVHMTVCLSDSQLHLFLQTQLPVGHIQDCVQGHTPYSVTDAILTYASSNRGFAQAQEDDSIKEPSLTVSYESMESPAPHQPCPQTKGTVIPHLVSCRDSDPVEALLEPYDEDAADLQHKEKPSVRVLQKNNHLEAVVADCGPAEVSFFLGESRDEPESLSPAEQMQHRGCRIQTPVEVHSPMGAGFEVNCGVDTVLQEHSVREESHTTSDTEGKTHPDAEEEEEEEADQRDVDQTEKSVNPVTVLDFKDSDAGSQEDVCSEKQVSEDHVISEAADRSCPEEQQEPDNEKRAESEGEEETPLDHKIPEVQSGDSVQQLDQGKAEQEVDLIEAQGESDEDSRSLPSSNESIVKVSDEESVSDEPEDSIQAANGFVKTSPEEVALWSEVETAAIMDLHMNGHPEEHEDLRYTTEVGDLSTSLDLNSTVAGGDLTENSDFSVLESSCSPRLADSKHTEQETLSSLSLDAAEETHEVEAH